MKERTCLLIEYTSAPLPLTVPIARYPLPRDVSLTLSFRSRLSLSLSLPPFFPSTLSKVPGSARATLTHDLRSVDTCLLTYRNRGILSGIRMRDQIFE